MHEMDFYKTSFYQCFERSLFGSPSMHLFYQKYSKNSNIVKYLYNLK